MESTACYRCHSKMIIFKSLLTAFEAIVIFIRSWGSIENWLKPKTISLYASLTKFSLSKSLIRKPDWTSAFLPFNLNARAGGVFTLTIPLFVSSLTPHFQKSNEKKPFCFSTVGKKAGYVVRLKYSNPL